MTLPTSQAQQRGAADSAHAAEDVSPQQPFPELPRLGLLHSTTAFNHIQFLTGERMETATDQV